ncbi:MAG: clostripain-related cysteine peptidase [Marinisporobacter sp.]|nr:clostripain-related cysteine peptidase [Marinisporobacter sp.]
MKKFLSIFLCTTMMLLMMANFVAFAGELEEKPYTVLVYLNGSDLESEGQAGTNDLIEMMEVGSTENVNVIVQTGGTKNWAIKDISNDQNQRWLVKQGELELLENVGNVSMGQPETLQNFIEWGMMNYPAEKYALVFWNHGAGSVIGYGVDELHNFDGLTLNELDIAMKNAYETTNETIEVIGFDACLMAGLEVADLMRPFGNYLVAAEELEPGHGWNYTPILKAIDQNPQINGDALGKAIADGFKKQAQEWGTADTITLSVTDLSKIENVVAALNPFVTKIKAGIQEPAKFPSIIKARAKAEAYGDAGAHGGSTDMVDLGDFAKKVSSYYPTEANNLLKAIDEAVVYNIVSPAKPDANGLSIYFPSKDKDNFNEKWNIYKDMKFLQPYRSVVGDVTMKLVGHTQGVSFESAPQQVSGGDATANDDYIEVKIDPNELENIESIYCVVGKVVDPETDSVVYFGSDAAVEYVEDQGVVRYKYPDGWEMLGGQFVFMDVLEIEDQYELYTIPAKLNKSGKVMEVDMVVLYDENHPQGKILGARKVANKEAKAPDKNLIKIEKGDKITPMYYCEKGEDSGYLEGEAFVVGDTLKIQYEEFPAGEYVFGFQIVDYAQNQTSSDYFVIEYGEIEE